MSRSVKAFLVLNLSCMRNRLVHVFSDIRYGSRQKECSRLGAVVSKPLPLLWQLFMTDSELKALVRVHRISIYCLIKSSRTRYIKCILLLWNYENMQNSFESAQLQGLKRNLNNTCIWVQDNTSVFQLYKMGQHTIRISQDCSFWCATVVIDSPDVLINQDHITHKQNIMEEFYWHHRIDIDKKTHIMRYVRCKPLLVYSTTRPNLPMASKIQFLHFSYDEHKTNFIFYVNWNI